MYHPSIDQTAGQGARMRGVNANRESEEPSHAKRETNEMSAKIAAVNRTGRLRVPRAAYLAWRAATK